MEIINSHQPFTPSLIYMLLLYMIFKSRNKPWKKVDPYNQRSGADPQILPTVVTSKLKIINVDKHYVSSFAIWSWPQESVT